MLPYKTLISVYRTIACYTISVKCDLNRWLKALHQPHRERDSNQWFQFNSNKDSSSWYIVDVFLCYDVNISLILSRCGVISIQLSPEQISQGCEVKQVELSPSTLYPKCCQKFVKCPTPATKKPYSYRYRGATYR